MRCFLAVLFSVLLAANASAQNLPDFSTLYERATLDKWQASFREDITALFKEDILPILNAGEREALRDVHLEFPQVGEHRGVFDFYAANRTVTLPVVSLRFFGDLALAYGWLSVNEFNVGTVQQYVGMIHCRPITDFEGKAYPRPLDALRIPAGARENPKVAARFTESFSTGVFFILAHELGHIRFRHPGNRGVDPRISRANEAEADAFALELMRRKRLIPWGALFWFSNAACVEPHRVDFATPADFEIHLRSRTHPLSGDRIESLARRLEETAPDLAKSQPDPVSGLAQILRMVGEFRKIANVLNDEGPHNLLRKQSLATDPSMLVPRRATAAEGSPFSGTYACKLTGPNGAVEMQIKFQRLGQKVIAECVMDGANVRIMGVVDGPKLTAEWWDAKRSGKAVFRAEDGGGTFTGTWGAGESSTGIGAWNGRRQP